MKNNNKLILVLGATGLQGGAVLDEALAQGLNVRALVRDVTATKAQAFIKRGVDVVVGDFDNLDSLENAMKGVDVVFSVPISGIDTIETDRERRQARAIIQSALKMEVPQFIHTSVAASSRHKSFPNWGTGYWFEKYWTDKWDIEEEVRNAGFPNWTILKPAMVMENFTEKVELMYPDFKQGEINTVTYADTNIDYISIVDLAKFVCASIAKPELFNEQSIELAAESLSYPKVAAIISEVTGKELKANTLTHEEAKSKGIHPLSIKGQEWDNVVGYNVDISELEKYGIQLTTFKQYAEHNRDDFIID